MCVSVSVGRAKGLEKWDLVSGHSSEWAPAADLGPIALLLAALSVYLKHTEAAVSSTNLKDSCKLRSLLAVGKKIQELEH